MTKFSLVGLVELLELRKLIIKEPLEGGVVFVGLKVLAAAFVDVKIARKVNSHCKMKLGLTLYS